MDVKRVIRTTLLTIVIIFSAIILLLGLLYASVQLNEIRDKRSDKLRSVGVYEFNFNESIVDINSSDSLILKNLTLVLNKDNSFMFSRTVPHFNDSIGVWRVEGFGVDDFIILYFSNGYQCQIGVCCGKDNEITMSYPFSADGSFLRYGRLGFVKKAPTIDGSSLY